jgi:hypothetical protein
MIKQKDKEIQNLRGKLNVLSTMHSQTKAILEIEKEKDQIKSLRKQNERFQANIERFNEEKTTTLLVKLAKKITIPDVEEIPTTLDQGKII